MQQEKQLPCLRWLALMVLTLPVTVWAQGSCTSVAQIVSVQGEIRINGIVLDNAKAMRERTDICVGDLVSAGQLSRATIAILKTEAVIRIDQNSELRLNVAEIADPSFLELLKGAINILSPKPVDLGVKTAFVNAAVEGTEFNVRIERDQATVTVLEGQVRVTDSNGRNEIGVSENQAASAKLGQAPTLDLAVDATNIGTAVQWAQFYPPVLDYRTPMPALTSTDPLFHARQAARYLETGRVDEARQAIDEARRLDKDNEEAWALSLIIELAQYDRTPKRTRSIRDFLDAAQGRTFSTTAGLIALSYAQQWDFNLQGALESLQTAYELNSNNVLVVARLSEVWLSLGDLDAALQHAEMADSISSSARAKTVLGFAYLAQIKIREAEKAFYDAIEEGASDPLPLLGLGLAKIRRGDLDRGRLEIVAAAVVDQGSAILRSYLGKAYYEGRDSPQDAEQYAIAKALDPNDPTPWFYDAIRKQTENDPIGALLDLQDSISKNKNRAVFRSRLKLDEDLAARSASQGRIFTDLGFEQSALVQGWASVNTDPSDFSGHRFLADTYSVLPRHEIARVSELLQSQLLQPTNIAPIQPQLAETNLFILSGAGPSDVGFNEFNPLFASDGIRFQANGIIGENGTVGNDLVVSGISGPLSFSVGQFHYETDGIRENNFQDRDSYNAFAQVQLSAKTDIQAEYRLFDSETGDLGILFDRDIFSPNARVGDDSELARFGLHHKFGPGSDLIANISYADTDNLIVDLTVDPLSGLPSSTEIMSSGRGWNAEVQHLYGSRRVRLTSGVGAFDADRRQRFLGEIQLPFPPFVIMIDDTTEGSISQENLYVYALLDQSDRLTWTLGVSVNFYEEEQFDRDQWNPKFGVSWKASSDTTVRAAAFRTLTRPLVANQTIEPTQVAGFNQFFDGIEGEEVWRYGLAVDHRFSRRLFSGLEFSIRDVTAPVVTTILGPMPTQAVERFDWDEQLARAYLHWAATDRFSIGADYIFEDVERPDVIGPGQVSALTTHRVPVTLGYYHPAGLSGRLAATYIDQEGVFGTLVRVPGEDSFTVLDASISYRLPKRYGIVSIVAKNLFDENFQFQDTDPANPRVQPDRLVLMRITLSF